MSKRKWNIYSSLAYFYNAFSSLADGKLVEEETSKILEVLLGWTKQEDDDLKAMALFVVQAETWLNEDIDGSTDKKDLVNNSLDICIEIVKEKLTKDQSKAVLIDLVKIGMADGNYDESEKGWVKMFADRLGIEPPILSAEKSTDDTDTEEWTIIHDIGVFYMFFANLAGMKEPEQDFIDEMLPKWNFGIDGINYGFSHGNPSDLNRTMSDIFIYLYGEDGKEDPSDKVGKSHKNLAMYFNDGEKPGKGSFTLGNLQTFLDTLYNLCLADGNVSPAQKDQLTVCCKQWQSVSGYAETILEKLDKDTMFEQMDEMFDAIEFDAEGRPIEKTDHSDDTDVPKEKTVSRKKTKKPKPKKKLTLHEQLASELEKLYPNSEVKKINEGNKLDIHLPDVNNKKGTHICFNCTKTGQIKIHFYSRDKIFNEDVIKRNSGVLEETSGRIRLIGYPSFKTVKDAIKSAEGFIKLLSGSSKLKKEETKKPKRKKKLTVQGQLVDELSKLYPNADVKKVDEGNYLDIHMPDIHPKRGTHIWFNTPKAGGIKVGFFCRDKDFIEDALKRNPATIETYSNGLRLLGHPTFKKVDDAIKVADTFVKMLKK